MPTYVYSARDAKGRRVRGTVEAADPRKAVEALRADGFVVTGLAVSRDLGPLLRRGFKGSRPARGRPDARALAVFCRQMATLLEAGVPVLQAMQSVSQQAPGRALGAILAEVIADVERGAALSEAVARRGDRLPAMMAPMLGAAEVGGFLDTAFRRLGEHFEKEDALRQRIRSATLYPKIIAAAGFGLMVLLFTVVLPNFAGLFAQLGADVPPAVAFLMAASEAAARHWYVLGGLAAAALGGWRWFGSRPEGRRALDRWQLRAPVLGPLRRKEALARLCRTLGTLLEGGVPLLAALDAVRPAAGNSVLERVVGEMAEEVRRGGRLLEPLRRNGLLPPLAAAVLASGEETGSFHAMLQRVADMYDEEVQRQLQRLVALVEPGIILVLGLVVGLILVSIFNPLFSLYQGF